MLITNFPKLIGLAGFCALTTILSSIGQAKEPNITQSMNLFGKVLLFPPPAWVKPSAGKDALKLSAFNRKQNKNTFLFEMVPKSEGFQNWKSLYAVIAMNGVMSPKRMKTEIMGIFKKACTAKTLKIERIAAPRKDLMRVVYCGSYKQNPAGGQIGVFYFAGSGKVTTRVYHEWRGSSFNPSNDSEWPVSKAQLSQTISAMLDNVRLGK